MQTTERRRSPFSTLVILALALVILIAGLAGAAALNLADHAPWAGSGDAPVEQVAPTYARPADRPAVGDDTAPSPGAETHRPTDRPRP